jgi:hypothetical protein
MTCCGERRRALTQSLAKPVIAATPQVISKGTVSARPPQKPNEPTTAPVLLRYVGNSNIRVRGHVTNRLYAFAARGLVVSVDARDAAILLRSSAFQRA